MLPIDVDIATTTDERGHVAPYLLRVVEMSGMAVPSDPPVLLAPGATRVVNWNWERSGNVAGVWIMTRAAIPEDLGFLSLQISITTEPLGTANDSDNDQPWNVLQQQGRFWEFMPLDIDVQANLNPWTLALTNDPANPNSVDVVFFFDFEAEGTQVDPRVGLMVRGA